MKNPFWLFATTVVITLFVSLNSVSYAEQSVTFSHFGGPYCAVQTECFRVRRTSWNTYDMVYNTPYQQSDNYVTCAGDRCTFSNGTYAIVASDGSSFRFYFQDGSDGGLFVRSEIVFPPKPPVNITPLPACSYGGSCTGVSPGSQCVMEDGASGNCKKLNDYGNWADNDRGCVCAIY